MSFDASQIETELLSLERVAERLAYRVGEMERWRVPKLEQGLAQAWAFAFWNATVSGQVNGCGGVGVPAAKVEIKDHATGNLMMVFTTGAGGAYSGSLRISAPSQVVDIVATPTGAYAGRFSGPATLSSETLTLGANAVPTITLTPVAPYVCRTGGGPGGQWSPSEPCSSGQICITVVNDNSGGSCALVPGVGVTVSDPAGLTSMSSTDINGQVCVPIDFDGPHDVTVSVPGLSPITTTVNATCGTNNVTVHIPASVSTRIGFYSATAQMCDTGGSHWCVPSLSASGGSAIGGAVSADGHTYVWALKEGTYDMTVSFEGYSETHTGVGISNCGTTADAFAAIKSFCAGVVNARAGCNVTFTWGWAGGTVSGTCSFTATDGALLGYGECCISFSPVKLASTYTLLLETDGTDVGWNHQEFTELSMGCAYASSGGFIVNMGSGTPIIRHC